MLGATLSNTTIVCAQVVVLLQASVALKVRVTTNLFAQTISLVTSPTTLKVTEPLQLSVAVTPVVLCAGIALAQVTVVFVGQVMLGATSSLTVIVCEQVDVLLHKSVARNVRVTVYLLTQLTLLVTSPTNATVTAPPQLSDALTPVVFCAGTDEEQVTVMLTGQLIVGACVSFTVINCAQVAVLLHKSAALNVRVIVYLLAQLTLLVTSLTNVTVATPPQLSPAVTPVVVCAGTALEQLTVAFVGQLMVGATLSNTVMICAQVAVLLHKSVARNVRVTVNLFTQIMLLVTSPTRVMLAAPLQLSVAVTPVVVCAGIALAQVTVVLIGQVMLGATLSLTVIVCAQVELLPHKSAAL